MVAHPNLPFSVDNTLGPLLVGGLVAAAFWGITTAQTYVYYQRFPKDPLLLKSTVAILWFLNTLDGCLTGHVLYYYLVTNYLNPLALAKPVWSLLIHVAVTSVTDAIIRSMYARRVWKLSGGNYLLTVVVGLVTLCDLVVGLVITVKAFSIESYMQLGVISILFYVNFSAGMFGDLFVAVMLCYYLFKARTGFRSTDSLVNNLITYIITTGLFTSVDATLGVVFYATSHTNLTFIGFYLSLAKLYINSYLALLNARQRLREKSDGRVSFVVPRPTDHACSTDRDMSLSIHADKVPHRDLEVRVETTVDRKSEHHLAHC